MSYLKLEGDCINDRITEHFIERLEERFGVSYNQEIGRALVGAILNGQTTIDRRFAILKQPHHFLHILTTEIGEVCLVWDANTATLISVYTAREWNAVRARSSEFRNTKGRGFRTQQNTLIRRQRKYNRQSRQ